eukprot:scaffold1236_cov116-Isochrysis_galbana.AAC.7
MARRYGGGGRPCALRSLRRGPCPYCGGRTSTACCMLELHWHGGGRFAAAAGRSHQQRSLAAYQAAPEAETAPKCGISKER